MFDRAHDVIPVLKEIHPLDPLSGLHSRSIHTCHTISISTSLLEQSIYFKPKHYLVWWESASLVTASLETGLELR